MSQEENGTGSGAALPPPEDSAIALQAMRIRAAAEKVFQEIDGIKTLTEKEAGKDAAVFFGMLDGVFEEVKRDSARALNEIRKIKKAAKKLMTKEDRITKGWKAAHAWKREKAKNDRNEKKTG